MSSNLHVFKIIYLPYSRNLPSRIKITSERFQQSEIVSTHIVDFAAANTTEEMAAIWLAKKGFNIVAIGKGWDCMYVISDTFKPLKA